jgi:hypothetical protein
MAERDGFQPEHDREHNVGTRMLAPACISRPSLASSNREPAAKTDHNVRLGMIAQGS